MRENKLFLIAYHSSLITPHLSLTKSAALL
jgi:hypothetical protein